MHTPIHVRGLAEFLSTLPHQLGYVPSESLVLVLLVGTERPGSMAVQLTARLDLSGPDEWTQLREAALRLIARERPDAVEILAFEGSGDTTDLLTSLGRRCTGLGVAIDHVARVRDGRFRSLSPSGEGVWRPVPPPDTVPATADLVLSGRQPGPDRAGFAALLCRGDEVDTADLMDAVTARALRLERAAARGPGRKRQVGGHLVECGAAAWQQVLTKDLLASPPADLPTPVVADALVALEFIQFRDALVVWLVPGSLGPGLLPARLMHLLSRELPSSRWGDPRVLDRLVDLAGSVPFRLAGPLMTVLAHTAWAHNNGVLANAAIDRAMQIDPGYSLARLTEQVLQRGVRPPGGPFADVG